MKTTRPALIALTAALTLGITACGSTDDPDAGDETATVSSSSTSDSTGSDDDTTDDDDAASADDATADSSDDSTTGSSGDGDLQSVLDAIEAAEKEADGTAYEVDDQDDDGSWEIDVATGTQTIEVEVSEDGKATTDDEDDLDDEDTPRIAAWLPEFRALGPAAQSADWATEWTALLGASAGGIGAYVMLRKRSLMSDAISHATLPGLVMAFILMAVTLILTVGVSVLVQRRYRKWSE